MKEQTWERVLFPRLTFNPCWQGCGQSPVVYLSNWYTSWLCCVVHHQWDEAEAGRQKPHLPGCQGNSPENFQGGCGVGVIDFPESQLAQLMDLLVRSCKIVMGCCLLSAKKPSPVNCQQVNWCLGELISWP